MNPSRDNQFQDKGCGSNSLEAERARFKWMLFIFSGFSETKREQVQSSKEAMFVLDYLVLLKVSLDDGWLELVKDVRLRFVKTEHGAPQARWGVDVSFPRMLRDIRRLKAGVYVS